MIETVLESSTHMGPIIGYAISRIFQRGVIIPKIAAFQACSLHWGHIEKWLIQFWNRLLVSTKCTMCDFKIFSTKSNNSRFHSILGVFSVG